MNFRWIFSIFFIFVAPAAWSADIFSQRPNPFTRFYYSDLFTRTLGQLCTVVPTANGSIPCDPAELAHSEGSAFSAGFFIGDDYEIVNRYRQLLDSDKSLTLVKSLFKEKSLVIMEASAAINMRAGWLVASFSPLQLSYFSTLRNQANPQLAVSVVQDRSLRLMAGKDFRSSLAAGVQVRLVERKFIEDDFSLLQAVADIDSVLQVREQHIIYVEPSLKYKVWPEWQGQLSLMMTNIGWTDRRYDETRLTPIYDIGFGIIPPISLGALHLATSYRWDEQRTIGWKHWRWGGSYALGLISAALSWSQDAWSTGVFSNFWSLRIGISYENKTITGLNGHSAHEDGVYSEFAYVF